MEIEILIKSGMGLVVILAVLMFFLFYSSSKKKQKVVVEKETKKEVGRTPTFEELKSVLRNPSSSSQDLKNALDQIIKHYSKISKHSKKTFSDFDPYMTIFYNICRHPNTTKDIILNFDKELSRINPEFKSDINDAVTKGVNSRGA